MESNNATTIAEFSRVRKLLFAFAALCAVLACAALLPRAQSLVCERASANWSSGWSAWNDGDASRALSFWSKDLWLAGFAPRPARLYYWRARAMDELGMDLMARDLRRAAARKYPFDFYTFLMFRDGGASLYESGAVRSTARLFCPRPWNNEVAKAALKTGVNGNMIRALMKRESKFKPDAVSRTGAIGLMQLMPRTAAEEARQIRLAKPDLLDPEQNILLGAKHFAILKRRFAGELPRAVAAYNAGSASVNRWNTLNANDWAEWVENIPYQETREFVRSVLENAETYRIAYGSGAERPLALTASGHPSPIPSTARANYKIAE